MTRIPHVLSSALFVLAACSGTSTTTSPDGGHADGHGSGTVDAPASVLDPHDCDLFANNAVAAQQACGGAVPPGGAAALAMECKNGIAKAALCGGNPAAGMACFRSLDATDFVCDLGVALPSCNGDLDAVVGMYCLVELGNPECASIQCNGSLDCPTGASCNQVTHQCFSNNAYCVGLPCDGSLDCPGGESCNTAEHACIKS
jgi:hypothetical protein